LTSAILAEAIVAPLRPSYQKGKFAMLSQISISQRFLLGFGIMLTILIGIREPMTKPLEATMPL